MTPSDAPDPDGINVPCEKCGTPPEEGDKHFTCTGCRQVFYCSENCQRAGWRGGHKTVCRAVKAEREKREKQMRAQEAHEQEMREQLAEEQWDREKRAQQELLRCPLNGRRDKNLCPEQRDVVEGLRRPFEIIHGPPGTGKSTTIRAIGELPTPMTSEQSLMVVCPAQFAIEFPATTVSR